MAGVEVRGELGDLVAEPIERGDVLVSGDEVRSIESGLHGESLRVNLWSDSTPRTFSHLCASRRRRNWPGNRFRRHRPPRRHGAPALRAGRALASRRRPAAYGLFRSPSSEKSRRSEFRGSPGRHRVAWAPRGRHPAVEPKRDGYAAPTSAIRRSAVSRPRNDAVPPRNRARRIERRTRRARRGGRATLRQSAAVTGYTGAASEGSWSGPLCSTVVSFSRRTWHVGTASVFGRSRSPAYREGPREPSCYPLAQRPI